MHSDNITDRHGELEKLPTQQLDQMLQAELQKEDADPAEAIAILTVLREREKHMPAEIGDNEKQAWRRYRAREKEGADKPAKKPNWVLRIASVAAVFCVLIIAIAYHVEAEGFWDRLARWTDSVIEFFSPEHSSGWQQSYEFRTDHPGLQQVYDTAVEIGITEPVVPMWLPEGYTAVSCKEMTSDNKTTVTAYFQNEDKVINYNLAVYSKGVPNQYQKDKTDTTVFEIEGISHYILRNTDAWVTVWTKENIECSISVDCQKDELYKILRSIYDKEDAQ